MFADFRLGGTNRIGARHHSARMLPLEGFTFRLSRRQIATESHSPPAFPSEHLLVFDDFRLGGTNRTAPVTTVGRPAEDRMLSDYLKRD